MPDGFWAPVVGRVDYGAVHHDYPAADVFARCGSRVVVPVDGTIPELSRVDRWDPSTDRGADRGGLPFSVRGRDGVRRRRSLALGPRVPLKR
ncbi:MAG: hypothetical protein ABIQ59_01160 [Nocardioidaceae bacterium]